MKLNLTPRRTGGCWRSSTSHRTVARTPPPSFEAALSLDPSDSDTLASLSEVYLAQGKLDEAERFARDALETTPEHQDALIAMGRVLLRRGQLEDAREHALWALRANSSSPNALSLLVEIKARVNPFLGLWWRFNTAMNTLTVNRRIAVLLGGFVSYRVLETAATQAEQQGPAFVIQMAWLALCAYTWVGPVIFGRMLQRELSTFRLRPGF